MDLRWLQFGFRLGGQLAPGWAAQVALQRFCTPRRTPPPGRELVWRASAERLVLPVGPEGAVAAWSFGPPDAPPVVLVHGWEGRGTQLAAFAAPLVAQGHRVLALDLPAHGESPGRELDPGGAVQVLRDLEARLGPFAGLIGHSFGGACSALALHAGLRAERAVLIASPASLPAVSRFFARKVGLPPRAQAAFFARLRRRQATPFDPTVPQALAEQAYEPWRLARDFRLPGLVIHDPGDPDVPFSNAEQIAGAWPGAELQRADRLGHRRVLRAPATVERVAAFFRGGPLSAQVAPAARGLLEKFGGGDDLGE